MHSTGTNVNLTFSTTNLHDSYRCLTACNLSISAELSLFSLEAIGESGKETIYLAVINLYLTNCLHLLPCFPLLLWDVAMVPNYMWCECCCLQFKTKYTPILQNFGGNTDKQKEQKRKSIANKQHISVLLLLYFRCRDTQLYLGIKDRVLQKINNHCFPYSIFSMNKNLEYCWTFLYLF